MKIKSVKIKGKSYSDLCKNCQTPNLCVDFGVFSDCLKGKKRKHETK